jgi:hypothetical protein
MPGRDWVLMPTRCDFEWWDSGPPHERAAERARMCALWSGRALVEAARDGAKLRIERRAAGKAIGASLASPGPPTHEKESRCASEQS